MAYTHFNKTIVQIHPLMEVEQGVLCDWELSDMQSFNITIKGVNQCSQHFYEKSIPLLSFDEL